MLAVIRGSKYWGVRKGCLPAQPAQQAYNFDNNIKHIELLGLIKKNSKFFFLRKAFDIHVDFRTKRD
jgi:hypothetical protein